MRERLIALVMSLVLMTVGLPSAQAAGVVGSGTPASCTRDALAAALVGGGSVTFNCGPNPVTISITATLETSAPNATIDGGGLITLQGAPGVRILRHFTWGTNAASTLTLRNLTLRSASISGVGDAANGAAILSQNQSANWNQDLPTLNIENVTFDSNVSTLTGLPAQAGIVGYDFGGGAIFSLGGIVNISGSTFINNRANGGAGGAVHGLGSSITITGSSFSGNRATPRSASDADSGYGGALYVDGTLARGGGAVTISSSTFSGSQAANQGGFAYINLYASRNERLTLDRVRVTDSVVSGGAMGLGGALSGGGTGGAVPVTITNSLFANNTVSGGARGASGGALAFAQAANIVIANSTFTGNRANGVCSECWNANGGAIYIVNNPTPFQIINTTIANNDAGWVGGGLSSGQSGVIRNTVFANNTAQNGGNGWGIQQHCSAVVSNGGNNLQWPDRNPNPNFWNEIRCADGITAANPLIGTTLSADGTLIPAAGSPLIDAGSSSVCAADPILNRDQRGGTRPIDGDSSGSAVCDIGAHEVVPIVTAALNGTVTLQGRTAGSPAVSGTLTVQLYQNSALVGSYTPTTDVNGAFSLSGLSAGSYLLRVKHGQYLALAQEITLVGGANAVSIGPLRAGDVDNNNRVNLIDFSILAASFNRVSGQTGYDARADLNGDGQVSIIDFSLLAGSFNQVGAP